MIKIYLCLFFYFLIFNLLAFKAESDTIILTVNNFSLNYLLNDRSIKCIDSEFFIDSVPINIESKAMQINYNVLDETSCIKCFYDLKYHFVLKNKKEIMELLNFKIEDIVLENIKNEKFNIKTVSIYQITNTKFIEDCYFKEDLLLKENMVLFENKIINKKIKRNGGVFNLNIEFEYKNKRKSISMIFIYFKGNKLRLNKKYSKLRKKGKIPISKKLNPECCW